MTRSPEERRSASCVRAGRYVNQSTGYRAFIPKPLPPDTPVRVDGELQVLLSRADRALGRLDGSIQTLPTRGRAGGSAHRLAPAPRVDRP